MIFQEFSIGFGSAEKSRFAEFKLRLALSMECAISLHVFMQQIFCTRHFCKTIFPSASGSITYFCNSLSQPLLLFHIQSFFKRIFLFLSNYPFSKNLRWRNAVSKTMFHRYFLRTTFFPKHCLLQSRFGKLFLRKRRLSNHNMFRFIEAALILSAAVHVINLCNIHKVPNINPTWQAPDAQSYDKQWLCVFDPQDVRVEQKNTQIVSGTLALMVAKASSETQKRSASAPSASTCSSAIVSCSSAMACKLKKKHCTTSDQMTQCRP